MPASLPYLDYSEALPRVDKLATVRTEALTGFAANKTPDGPLVGAYGELIAEIYFEDLKTAGRIRSYRYTGGGIGPDFEIDTLEKTTLTVDVKTKRRSGTPRANYEMSVPAYLSEHPAYVDPDFFLCVSLAPYASKVGGFKEAWIVGSISGEKFRANCYRIEQDSPVGGQNGVSGKMPCDVFNSRFSKLNKPKGEGV